MARRRLGWERSWFFVALGVCSLGGLVAYSIESDVFDVASGDFVLPLVALPVVFLMFRRGLTGSRSKRQLWIDVPAGTLIFVDGGERPLDSLGALSIEKRYVPRTQHSMPTYKYQLKAAGFERPLFVSFFEGETKRRFDALDGAIVQSALRRLLERPQGEGAFRGGPDLGAEAVTRAGSAERALAALRTLAQDDHDAAIREAAKQLASALEASARASRQAG